MRRFLRMILPVALLAAPILGQDSWTLGATAPPGFVETATATRITFSRRLPKLKSRLRIETEIVRSEAKDVEAFLADQRRSGDADHPVPSQDVRLAGRAGRRHAYKGPLRLPRRVHQRVRLVQAAKLAPGVFLRVETAMVFPDAEPPPRLTDTAKAATGAVVKSLVVKASEATPDSPQAPAAGPDTDTYRNDHVVPYAFDFPEDWYVCHADSGTPGFAWALATPRQEEALTSPLSDLDVAMRVCVVGFAPALLGSEADELARAAAMIRSARAAGGEDGAKPTVEARGDALLGNAEGRVLSYRFPDGSGRRDGLILVAAADSSVLVADFSFGPGQAAGWEPRALSILDTFRLDLSRGVTVHGDPPDVRFSYPRSWSLRGAKTDDDTRAFVLTAPDQLELVTRSVPLAEGTAVDDAAFRRLASAFLADEMKLCSSDDVARAAPLAIPGAASGIHLLKPQPDRLLDVFGFLRGGSAHFCFLELPGGVQSRSYGLAVRTMLSLTGPRPALAAPALAATERGRVVHPTFLRHCAFDPFDDDGAFTGMTSGRIELLPDGTARYAWRPRGARAERARGRYRISANRLELTLTGRPEPRTFRFDPRTGKVVEEGDGLVWYAAPPLR